MTKLELHDPESYGRVSHRRCAATGPTLSEVDRVGSADRGHQLTPNPRQSRPVSPGAPLNRAFRLNGRDDLPPAESRRLLASAPRPAAAHAESHFCTRHVFKGAALPESRRLPLHASARHDAQCPGPRPSRARSCATTNLPPCHSAERRSVRCIRRTGPWRYGSLARHPRSNDGLPNHDACAITGQRLTWSTKSNEPRCVGATHPFDWCERMEQAK